MQQIVGFDCKGKLMWWGIRKVQFQDTERERDKYEYKDGYRVSFKKIVFWVFNFHFPSLGEVHTKIYEFYHKEQSSFHIHRCGIIVRNDETHIPST